MRVFVTGGAGFIGHHLVRGLLARGDEVSVIDDFSSGDRRRLAPFADRITLVEGSVLDPGGLDRAAAGCEAILHEAAVASVARSFEAPRAVDAVNVGGTIEVVLAAARQGVRRVVLAGSSAVYGVPAELPCHERLRPNPTSPYGAGKFAAESYLHVLGAALGVETVALRYFNVFGPGQDPAAEYAAVIPLFISIVLAGGRPTIHGSDAITRDFVHVANVVAANLRALDPAVPAGLTCNIASGERSSLRDLVDAIATACERPVEPVIGPARLGDIPDSQADIALAAEALGYRVEVGFAEGMAETVAWFRDADPVAADAHAARG